MTQFDVTQDPIAVLGMPSPSPTLSVLREATQVGGSFSLRHEPLGAPPAPPEAPLVRAGKRGHVFQSLTDGFGYVRGLMGKGAAPNPRAFVDVASMSVCIVLDDLSTTERETVDLRIKLHPKLQRWAEVAGRKIDHSTWLRFLRENQRSIADADGVDGEGAVTAEFIIGQYSSLSGTLTHESDEFQDFKRQCATFTVKKKARGDGRGGQIVGADRQVEDVPLRFPISVPVLVDSRAPTTLVVLVFTHGGEGGAIEVSFVIEEFVDHVSDAVEEALTSLSEVGDDVPQIPWFRGVYRDLEWTAPEMPKAVKDLMASQAAMLQAMAAGQRMIAIGKPTPN